MSVHYKFNAAKEYDTLPIDGLHISLSDLKEAIIRQKRLGKFACDLKVTNAETQQEYTEDKDLIPKNASLIIRRLPIDPALRKFGDALSEDKELLLSNPEFRMNTEGSEEAELIFQRIAQVPDLTKLKGTEQEIIATMMAQSSIAWHPSRYLKLRNTVMSGKVPASYKCYKCHQGGHWVSNCPLNSQDIRKCTGIPTIFLETVTDPKTPGSMITPQGKYVILRQRSVKQANPKVRPKFIKPPDCLKCPLCDDILHEAVMMPCCTALYCDECIRNLLIESDDQQCPSCKQTDIGPDALIPNRFYRLKAENFGLQYVTEDNENVDPSLLISLIEKLSSLPTKATDESKPTDEDVAIISPEKSDVSSVKKSPVHSPLIKDVHIKDVKDNIKESSPKNIKVDSPLIKDAIEDNTDEIKKDDLKEEETTENSIAKTLDVVYKKTDSPSSEIKDVAEQENDSSDDDSDDDKKHKKKKKGKKARKEKKDKKEKKEKKEKKLKKEKKEDKKEKKAKKIAKEAAKATDTEKDSENLMNEAVCPKIDITVPPPAYGYQSSGLYGDLGRETYQEYDPLEAFNQYLAKKDSKRRRTPSAERFHRSPSRTRDSESPKKSDRSRSRNRSPYGKRYRREYSPPEKQIPAHYQYNVNIPQEQQVYYHQAYQPHIPQQQGEYYSGYSQQQQAPPPQQEDHRYRYGRGYGRGFRGGRGYQHNYEKVHYSGGDHRDEHRRHHHREHENRYHRVHHSGPGHSGFVAPEESPPDMRYERDDRYDRRDHRDEREYREGRRREEHRDEGRRREESKHDGRRRHHRDRKHEDDREEYREERRVKRRSGEREERKRRSYDRDENNRRSYSSEEDQERMEYEKEKKRRSYDKEDSRRRQYESESEDEDRSAEHERKSRRAREDKRIVKEERKHSQDRFPVRKPNDSSDNSQDEIPDGKKKRRVTEIIEEARRKEAEQRKENKKRKHSKEDKNRKDKSTQPPEESPAKRTKTESPKDNSMEEQNLDDKQLKKQKKKKEEKAIKKKKKEKKKKEKKQKGEAPDQGTPSLSPSSPGEVVDPALAAFIPAPSKWEREDY